MVDYQKNNGREKFLADKYRNAVSLDEGMKCALELAAYLREHGKNADAKNYATIALELAQKEGNNYCMAMAYKELGLVNYFQLNMDKALENSLAALKIMQSLSNCPDIANVLNDIGVFYSSMELHDKALDYYKKGICCDPENTKIWNNIGDKYSHIGKPKKAINAFLTVLRLIKANTESRIFPTTMINIGNAHFALGKTAKAEICYKIGLEASLRMNNQREEFFALLGLGGIRLKYNKAGESEEYFLQALRIAESLESLEMLWFSYKHITELYEKTEQWRELSIYQKLCLDIRERMYSGNVSKRIAELETAYEIERKELEARKLIEKNARLASIGVMAAGITHEINQPLNAIVINTDGLLYKNSRDNILPDSYKTSVVQILDAAKRIDRIIKHMRSFWITPDFKPDKLINVNQTLLNALELVSSQIASHGIRLKKDLCSGTPYVSGNQVNLEQIIVNLATNSIHSLDSVKNNDKRIEIKTETRDNRVCITFTDNGAGIANDIGEKLYDPFYSTKEPGVGMGLGLAIVRQFIREMSGSIEHNPGEPGAIFEICLPLAREMDNGNTSD